MAYPAFAAQMDAASYTIRVRREDTSATVDVTVTLTTAMYWAPSASNASSIWKALVDALQAAAAWGGTWSVTFAAANATGVTATLRHSAVAFSLRYTSTPGTPLPLTLFGWTLADYTSGAYSGGFATLATVQPPKYTWFPKCNLNDKGFAPEARQIGSSEVTGDGSQYSVTQDDGTLRYWRHIKIDGYTGPLAARMSQKRLSDTWIDWATQAGLTTSSPYAAIDATDGWWSRTVTGQKSFIILQDESNIASIAGPYVITYQGVGAPFPMDGWKNLGPPNVTDGGASNGRRLVEICFREV